MAVGHALEAQVRLRGAHSNGSLEPIVSLVTGLGPQRIPTVAVGRLLQNHRTDISAEHVVVKNDLAAEPASSEISLEVKVLEGVVAIGFGIHITGPTVRAAWPSIPVVMAWNSSSSTLERPIYITSGPSVEAALERAREA